MAHLLRYGAAVHGSITRSNSQHMFSHTYALLIYDSNAIYSMIPKNGCTTMRLSIALANGAIADRSEWDWIHLNNDSFNPSFKELALASYRFTVLRCPYGRLVVATSTRSSSGRRMRTNSSPCQNLTATSTI